MRIVLPCAGTAADGRPDLVQSTPAGLEPGFSIVLAYTGGLQSRFEGNALLPKSLWATFDAYDQADSYAKQLEGLLGQGSSWSACSREPLPAARYGKSPAALLNISGTMIPGFPSQGTRHRSTNLAFAEHWLPELRFKGRYRGMRDR
jgi:hypothetical protein